MEVSGDQVVVDRYLGTWYQFASNPHFYEPAGTHNVMAQYQRDANGVITVTNSLQHRGKTDVIRGSLTPTSTPGLFRVRLERALLFFPITTDYRIEWLYLNEGGEYQVAIVGGGNSTYVLSRTPTISCELQAQIFKRLGTNRVNNLNFTAHTCANT